MQVVDILDFPPEFDAEMKKKHFIAFEKKSWMAAFRGQYALQRQRHRHDVYQL